MSVMLPNFYVGSVSGSFNPSAQGMGVGQVGIGDPNVIFKRKFRWTLQITPPGGCGSGQASPPYFVKLAARPSIQFEETEVHFMNDKIYIPSVYDFSKSSSRTMSSKRSGYCASVALKMYDGCGTVMETWTLGDAWPQAMNFGDLDMGSSEIADIQVTLRYSMVTYTAACGGNFSPCSCTGC